MIECVWLSLATLSSPTDELEWEWVGRQIEVLGSYRLCGDHAIRVLPSSTVHISLIRKTGRMNLLQPCSTRNDEINPSSVKPLLLVPLPSSCSQ